MVCSSCGFENDGTMRFCGMCGTPLPYRPLTTPEAQSTLKYTRLPLEEGGDTHEHAGRPVSSSATMVLPERHGGNGKPVSTATIASQRQNDIAQAHSTLEPQARNEAPRETVKRASVAEPTEIEPPARSERTVHVAEPDWRSREIETSTEHDYGVAHEAVGAPPMERETELHAAPPESLASPAETHEPPPRDMVPDVPFDEYLRSFHYEPPTEATEVTMRDTSVAEERVPEDRVREVVSAAPPEVPSPVSTPSTESEAQYVSFVSREEETPAGPAAATPESRDVEDRLGLDAQAAPEVVERPRFLDVHESPETGQRATSGTSTIVGPSFLGLSDSPELTEAASYEEEEIAHKSHWRGWLAAAVVLIFAGLGYMEWRTQVNQTDNGPVEIMKAKIRSWTNGATPAEPGVSSSSLPANTKPEMQVQEQPKPQAQMHSDNSSTPTNSASPSNAAGTRAQAGLAQSKPPVSNEAKTEPSSPSTSESTAAGSPVKATRQGNSAGPASSSSAGTTSGNPKPSRAAGASGDQQASGKTSPGADELKKATNASDSAAAAAWLWKSTAKGNPDAPVQLADMYMKGDGVPRSCEQAVVLLKTAAEKENARARNRLASIYASGNCVQRNRVEAYRWLSSALTANPHSDWAQQNKELLWQQMTPDERVMAAKYR